MCLASLMQFTLLLMLVHWVEPPLTRPPLVTGQGYLITGVILCFKWFCALKLTFGLFFWSGLFPTFFFFFFFFSGGGGGGGGGGFQSTLLNTLFLGGGGGFSPLY